VSSVAELQQQKKDEEMRKKKQEEEKQQRRRLRADDVFSDDDSEDSTSDKKQPEDRHSDHDADSVPSRRSSSSSSSSSSSESEAEAERREDENEVKKAQQIKTKDELSKIRLSRHRLERWCFMPYLRRIVVGCFVRIGIGAHQGKSVYRVSVHVLLFKYLLLLRTVKFYKRLYPKSGFLQDVVWSFMIFNCDDCMRTVFIPLHKATVNTEMGDCVRVQFLVPDIHFGM